jgi:DNA-binding Xre family transcriptional regulator
MRLVDAVQLRIKDLAKERNISMYRLCTMSGVPQTTVITMTRSSTVKLSTIYGICEGLEISLKEFFDSPRFKREIVTD